MKYKQLLLGACLLSVFSCKESGDLAKYRIIPQPEEFTLSNGQLNLKSGDSYMLQLNDAAFAPVAKQLEEYLANNYGIKSAKSANVTIEFAKLQLNNPEAYQLEIKKNKILISAATPKGVFYGFQTLRQMLPLKAQFSEKGIAELPFAKINDKPYMGYRGVHLDVARHFVTADSVKRFIDILAMHKMNTFHWHLTEDQGWRIEIKKYPRLTEIGSKRSRTVIGRNTPEYDNVPHGGFYTQEQIQEIVRYAADRYIEVIPEIDLPGHMMAALAAYPELGCIGKNYEVAQTWGVFDDVLCAGNPKTEEFIFNVLDEVMALFPSKYVHIGGDECPKERWKECAKCQAKIKSLGLDKVTDEHSPEERLQSNLTKTVEKYLNEHNRSLIGWDEIIEGGLSPTATVMAWRSASYAFQAAKSGNDAILTPSTHCYFDHYQTEDNAEEPLAIGGCSTLENVYNYVPVADTVSADIKKHILGVQANLWTEYMKTFSHVEYMLLPRLAALSEVAWSRAPKDYPGFLTRLCDLTARYQEEGYNFGKHIFDVRKELLRDTVKQSQSLKLTTMGGGDIRFTTDGSEPTINSELYKEPVLIDKTMTIKAAAFRQDKRSRVLTQSYTFSKSTLKPIKLTTTPHASYTFNKGILLNDGLEGGMNYRTGHWLGYSNEDLSAVVDFGEPTDFSKATIGTLVITGDWVFPPSAIRVYGSNDGTKFDLVKDKTINVNEYKDVSKIERHHLAFNPTKARYVKLEVVSMHAMPEWHPGKGKPAFVFVDEIMID